MKRLVREPRQPTHPNEVPIAYCQRIAGLARTATLLIWEKSTRFQLVCCVQITSILRNLRAALTMMEGFHTMI
jgi:hypothetical protein